MIMRIDDFIEATHHTASADELYSLFLNALHYFGVDRAVCGFLRQDHQTREITDHVLVRGYSEEWSTYYIENNCINHDPVCRLALEQPIISTWKDMHKHSLTPKETELLILAEDAGLHNGAAISLHLPNNQVLGIGFARSQKDKEFGTLELHKIHALFQQFTLMLQKHDISTPFHKKRIRLTKKETDVLRECALGKSNKNIADILYISEHAVNFHLRNIYRKLETNNRTMAVLKGIQEQLIDTLPI